MRSMTVFNYLLEATLFGSVLILLLASVRSLLRQRLGSRLIYWLWLVMPVRLLLPISFPNPLMDALRPMLSSDVGARPVADQVRRRLIDAGHTLSAVLVGGGSETIEGLTQNVQSGKSGKWILVLWLAVAFLVALWLLTRQSRFFDRVRKNRVQPLEGKEQESYLSLCKRYGVRPLPVYLADRLPVSCVAGIVKPFIALPLDVPPEHVPMLLAHQICHVKARDNLWGVVRCLCCAVHWFNPFVWMAAYVSYRDSEMACDDRVTSRLHDMDRLGYANAIVTAGEREGELPVSVGASFTDQHVRQRVTSVIRCVRGSRVGVAVGSFLAAAVLVVSFATSESEPLPTVAQIPAVAWAEGETLIADDMDAIAAARRFLQSEFVCEDTSCYSLTAWSNGEGWQVEATGNGNPSPILLHFAPSGVLVHYDGEALLGGLTFSDGSYTHRTLTQSVNDYMEAFAQTHLPMGAFQSGKALADVRAGDVRVLLGEMRGEGGRIACRFTLQVEPAPRVIRAEILQNP